MTYKERLDSVRQQCKDYIQMYMEEFESFILADLLQDYGIEGIYTLSHMRIEDGKVFILGDDNWGVERDFDLDDLSAENLALICDSMEEVYIKQKYSTR